MHRRQEAISLKSCEVKQATSPQKTLFSQRAVKDWDNLPREIENVSSIARFEKANDNFNR